MSKYSHVVTLPLVALSLALLFSLYLLAACSTGAGSLTQAIPNAVNIATPDTAVGDMTTPEAGTSGTATTASGQGSIVVDYKGIHFSADSSLAESIRPEVRPAIPALEGEPIWYAGPEHIRFTFANPRLLPGRLQMGINLAAEAQLLIYPVAELAEIDPWVQTQIETLQSLLAERGPVPVGDLPLLPNTNASQVFHAQAQYLDAGTVQGLRFITQHAQEVRPVNNQELFYTFQGLAGDGAYYVAAFFPVATAALPDKIEVEDWEAFSVSFATYLSETTAVLDQLPPAEFTPDLTLLDAVVTSLRMEPDSDSASSTQTPAGG